jgi:hypothetical protein
MKWKDAIFKSPREEMDWLKAKYVHGDTSISTTKNATTSTDLSRDPIVVHPISTPLPRTSMVVLFPRHGLTTIREMSVSRSFDNILNRFKGFKLLLADP